MRTALFAMMLASLVLAGWPTDAQAQWKWKDSTGQVHASDLPPPRGTPDKDILARPEPAVRRPAAPAAAASGPAVVPATLARSASAPARQDPELEARRKRAEAEAAQKQKVEDDKLAAQRAENCRRAREHLSTLDSGIRVARVNAKGEREILSDEQRAAESQRSRQIVASDCR